MIDQFDINDYAPSELEHDGAAAHVAHVFAKAGRDDCMAKTWPEPSSLSISVGNAPSPCERTNSLHDSSDDFNGGLLDGRKARDAGVPFDSVNVVNQYGFGWRAGWNDREREIARQAETTADSLLSAAYAEGISARWNGRTRHSYPPKFNEAQQAAFLGGYDRPDNSGSKAEDIFADYEPLADVLADATAQAACGKGKERHANNRPFLRQPIMEIGRMVGPGYHAGQAQKKLQEAIGMIGRGENGKAKHELLGAIVYTAALVLLTDELAKGAGE